MKEPENIRALLLLPIQFIGFIFYEKSKRFAGTLNVEKIPELFTSSIKRVGVFVNEREDKILFYHNSFQFDCIQLHGNESPELCLSLQQKGFCVVKVFGVGAIFDFAQLEPYLNVVDYFLFDTQTQEHGGSGKQFEHDILKKYTYEKPFFLSGGIGPEFDLKNTHFVKLPLFGLDVNSRFETEPGIKNIALLKEFLSR